MSKKQIRVTDPVQIKERIQQFVNKNINVVLRDNTVIFGKLKQVSSGGLLMTNMRQKKVTVPMENVLEFFTDIDA